MLIGDWSLAGLTLLLSHSPSALLCSALLCLVLSRPRLLCACSDFPSQGFLSDTELGAGIDASSNVIQLNPRQPDNNARYPSEFPIWLQYSLTRSEVNGSFTARVRDDDPDDDDNGGRAGGIKKSQPPSRDYTLRFGTMLRTLQRPATCGRGRSRAGGRVGAPQQGWCRDDSSGCRIPLRGCFSDDALLCSVL